VKEVKAMKVAILGSGSLGLLWGARLSRMEGLKTTLLTRTQAQAELLNETGIERTGLDGRVEIFPANALAVSECPPHLVFDIVWVMVKQTQLADVMPILKRIICGETQVVFWQNGWGHQEKIKSLKKNSWTYVAVTTEGAWKKAGNKVVHTGNGVTYVGLFPQNGREPHPQFISFLRFLSDPGETRLLYDRQILCRIWEKLAINCVINPLTAIYGIKNGELLKPEYASKWRPILEEVVQVSTCEGIDFFYEQLDERVREVCRRTARNDSSMLQDLKNGRKTEIDYINGAVVKTGAKHGVATPVNAELVAEIYEKERNMDML
jgi:2-dehydropantoate 2-reductase